MKGTDYYASKARSRTSALEELNGALADLATNERRAGAAVTRLETIESEARAELERTVAEAERELEEARRRARALYEERLHVARTERGTAESLVAKGRSAVHAARERLLKLVPPADQERSRAKTFHVSIPRDRLLAEIQRLGLRAVLTVPEGVAESDVLASIENDPREHLVMDPSCDRRTEDGMCAGHDAAEERA